MSQYGVALRKTCLTLTVACLAALLNGCGGGGGAASSKSFGNTIPQLRSGGCGKLFSERDRERLVLRHHHHGGVGNKGPGDGPDPHHGPEERARGVLLGIPGYRDRGSDRPGGTGGDFLFQERGRRRAFMGSNDPNGALSAAFAPYIQALFRSAPTTVASFSKSNVSLGDLDGDGRNDTATLALTSKVENFEALDTALGSLPRTLRTTEAFSGTLTLSANSWACRILDDHDLERARHRGRQAYLLGDRPGTTQQEEFDIRGYVSDNAAQGLSTPYVIEGDIAGNRRFPGRTAVLGTDGTHFLAVENTPNGLTGTLFDGNAKVLATVNLGSGGSPGLSFDGTNYVVAITRLLRLAADPPRDARGSGPGCPQRDYREPSRHAHNQLPRDLQRQRQHADRLFALRLGDQSALHVRRAHRSRRPGARLRGVPDRARPGHPLVPPSQLRRDQLPRGLGAASGLRGRPEPRRHLWSPRERRRGGARFPRHRDLDRPPGAVLAVIAFDATSYFVVWLDARGGGAQYGMYDIQGARLSPAGTVLDPAGIAVDAGGTQRRNYQSLAYSGTEYLIAWSDYAYANGGSVGVRLARMTPAGTVTTPAGAARSVVLR